MPVSVGRQTAQLSVVNAGKGMKTRRQGYSE